MSFATEAEHISTILTSSVPTLNAEALNAASDAAKAASGGSFLVYLDQLAKLASGFVPPPYQLAAVAIIKGMELLYSLFHASSPAPAPSAETAPSPETGGGLTAGA